MYNQYIRYTLIVLTLLITECNKVFSQSIKFGFEIIENKKSTVIPFETYSNLIVVDVLFQGVIPLKFIVDTGVTNTVLVDKIYSDILNIEPDRKLTLIGAAGIKEVEAYIVNSVSINVGEVRGHNIPLLILKEDYLKLEENLGIKIHGILGYDFLKNFVAKIDYSTETIKLYNVNKFNRRLFLYRKMDMFIESSKPYIAQTITFQDSSRINAKFMIDTGASHDMMLHLNSAAEISLPEKNIRDILGAGIAGNIEGHVARIPSIQIADYVLEEVVANYPDSGAYHDVIKRTGRNGTIGGGLMKHFTFYLDYNNEKLYIRKSKFFKQKFDYDMSGISVIAKGEYFLEPYYLINKVREGSPAALAGVKEKDILIQLNGISGKDLNLNYINKTLSKKEDKKIRLRVKRENETLNFEFKLKSFI